MKDEHKTLGIVGGMGPMATVFYMELVTKMTKAKEDSEHMDMIVISRPAIPDRTAFLLKKSDRDPLPEINGVCERLVASGAEVIAIPCVTAHCFREALGKGSDARILNAVEEVCLELKAKGISRAGIMATDGTLGFGLFQDAFVKNGIEPVIPEPEIQKLIMSLIYDDIKAGNKPDAEKYRKVRDFFDSKGAQKIVLGCTELSLLGENGIDTEGTVDVMEALARAAIRECGYEVREEYL